MTEYKVIAMHHAIGAEHALTLRVVQTFALPRPDMLPRMSESEHGSIAAACKALSDALNQWAEEGWVLDRMADALIVLRRESSQRRPLRT